MSVRTKEVNGFVTIPVVCKPKLKKPDKGWPKNIKICLTSFMDEPFSKKTSQRRRGYVFKNKICDVILFLFANFFSI